MAVNEKPTAAQAIQFLAAHARILGAVHTRMGTSHPVSIGFVKPADYPSPAIASIIFSTSLPIFQHQQDMRVRNALHKRMRGLLEDEVGCSLPEKAGRCVENEGFLSFSEAMRDGVVFESFVTVIGVNSLARNVGQTSRPLDTNLLAATTDEQVREIIHQNIDATLPMCEECEAACAYMDDAAVRDIAFELGRRRGGRI